MTGAQAAWRRTVSTVYEDLPTAELRWMKDRAEAELRNVRSLMDWERSTLTAMAEDLGVEISKRPDVAERVAA